MSIYISIIFAIGILLLGIMIVSQGHNQSAYGVNATEFLLYSSGYLNESMEFSMSTNGPSITGDYSNAAFGVDRITFPDGWSGQVKVPDASGLLTITAAPMTMNEVSNNQMMQFYNKSKFIPNIVLRVADKSIYQYPQEEITQNMSTPARDRLTPEQVPLFEQGLKALADKSGKSVAEVEELIKLSCKDVQPSSTTNIDGKPFQISFKYCNSPMGPIVHKTYLYEDKDKIYSLSLTGSQIIFMSLSPGVERPNIDQFVPILDQAAKSIKISSLSAPTPSMTDSGGSSMQADSDFRQPQISDNGSAVGQSTEIQTTTTNDTNTNIQNTAMDISLAVSPDPAFRGQDLVVYVNVVDSSKIGLTNAKVDGVIVDGPAAEQIIKNANSTQPIDISALEGQKFSGVTDTGQFTQLTKLSGDFTNDKFAVVVTASADGFPTSSKIAVFTTG